MKVEIETKDQSDFTQCEYKSTRKKNLQKHMLGNHYGLLENEKDQEFQCEECEYRCTIMDSLRIHQNKKRKEKPDVKIEEMFY